MFVQLNVKYNVYGTDTKTRRKRDTSVQRTTDVDLDVEQTQTDDKRITVKACAR